MKYEQYWRASSPGHIVYLIDLSGSMADKIDYTLSVMNSVFKTLVCLCAKGNEISPRLSCTVIGYNSEAKVIWDDMPIKEIARKVIAFRKCGTPIFNTVNEFKPQGLRYMRLAFDEAKKDIEKWIMKQIGAKMKIPAPVVINITVGSPYEGGFKTWDEVSRETLNSARALMNISTPDGCVRLFNIHYNPSETYSTMIFPSQCPSYPTEKFLYEASSIMDDGSIEIFRDYDINITANARCMICNLKKIDNIIELIYSATVDRI